jgi:hypothetical protein
VLYSVTISLNFAVTTSAPRLSLRDFLLRLLDLRATGQLWKSKVQCTAGSQPTYLSDIGRSHWLSVMSSASTQPGLCKPDSVPTFIPDVDMTADWCVTPEQGNATVSIMQQCCTSADVQSIGGCSFCYTEDSTAADKQEFNRNFAQCLFRGPQNQNLSRESASYCNTPTVSNSATLGNRHSWSMWSMAVLIGTLCIFEAFA